MIKKSLEEYLGDPLIKSIQFNDQLKRFMYTSPTGTPVSTGGLLRQLEKRYYPHYKHEKKKRFVKTKLQRRGSSAKQGMALDDSLESYVRTGKRPRMQMAQAIINYLEDACKHKICGAQVPAFVTDIGNGALKKRRITRADLITQDNAGRYYMVEVKAGYNQKRAQGSLYNIPGRTKVPNTIKNHWQLQRHYTEKALRQCGLPIHASYIVNVYHQGQTGVQVRKYA